MELGAAIPRDDSVHKAQIMANNEYVGLGLASGRRRSKLTKPMTMKNSCSVPLLSFLFCFLFALQA